MFVAYKNSDKKVLAIRGTEWQCRMTAKSIDVVAYNAWVDSITDSDGVITYPSETFTIVENNQDLQSVVSEDEGALRYIDYIVKPNISARSYIHLKWITTKKELVTDDDSLAAAQLAAEWVTIRKERDRLIAETDWMMLSDTGTVSAAWKNYRKALREIPQSQDSVKTFSDIDWPDKPSS